MDVGALFGMISRYLLINNSCNEVLNVESYSGKVGKAVQCLLVKVMMHRTIAWYNMQV